MERLTSLRVYMIIFTIRLHSTLLQVCALEIWSSWWALMILAIGCQLLNSTSKVGDQNFTGWIQVCTIISSSTTPIYGPYCVSSSQTLNCDTNVNSNSGCAIVDPSQASYGTQFNVLKGGIFAMLWAEHGISICKCSLLSKGGYFNLLGYYRVFSSLYYSPWLDPECTTTFGMGDSNGTPWLWYVQHSQIFQQPSDYIW